MVSSFETGTLVKTAIPGEPAPPGAGSCAIKAQNLRKVYKASGGQPAKEALKGINLNIPRGSFFALLGPNGAGKSTFINILAGLVMKSTGSASVWEFDIDVNPRQARASIGVVPQELNIDPFFTPLEALELQAGLYGVPRAERQSMEILEAMGLADKADAYARTLSGGMRRRLLVAKAMVHNPPVLVLDEPTAGVDLELRKQLWDYIKSLHAGGVTIVLTTHYLQEAQELCDQIAIINHGEVVCCEPTPQLLSRIDEKRIVVQPESALQQAPEALSAYHPEIRPDGRLALRYNRSAIRAVDLLAQISAAGIVATDISTEEADLEDVFLRLTSLEKG